MKWALIFGGGAVVFFLALSNSSAETTSPDIPQTQPDLPQGVFDPVIDANQIAQYAASAGFEGDDLTTAVAIALAESGGSIHAYNPVTKSDTGKPLNTPLGKGAIGLWQIYLNVHPEFSGWDLSDAQQNANAAFSVYWNAGRSFSPWTTFTNKKYQSFLNQASDAVAGLNA